MNSLKIKKVSSTEKGIVNEIVNIHLATFKGFFLTFMGRGFLKQMYMAYTKHKQSNIFVALQEDQVVGFLAYSENMSGLYKHMIKRRLIPFAWYSLGAFFRKPKVFMRLIRAFLKPGESKREEKYIELASIGVSPDAKAKGVGSQLINALKNEVDFNEFEYITLETDAINNEIANNFYLKNEFAVEREFETHEGRKMFEYRFRGEPQVKKKKLLYILNIAKRVNNFSYTSMIAAQNLGLEFHIAGNWSYASDEERIADEERYGIKIHQIDFIRAPYHPGNKKAYVQLKTLIENEQFDFMHCNTPIGGVVGRLLGKKCKVPKVIYQVHGFHFYKGAPLLNWMLYYPVEKWLARYTDALITINQEDFEFAKNKLKLRGNGNVYYVPGVGIDTSQYNRDVELRDAKRIELNIPSDAFVLISVGELNANKNNRVIVSALEQLECNNIHYVLCGVGGLESVLKKQADEAGLHENIHFLGYRNDVKELYGMADCFVMPSFREGLSRSIMEAMASGLPCIVSKIRGNVDLVVEGEGGYLCDTNDVSAYAEKLNILANDLSMREKMGANNLIAIKKFNVETVTEELRNVYIAEFGE